MGYASGKHAVGQCQRCGFKFPYRELREDGDTNLKVCADCYDISHPAEEPLSAADNIALYKPAPDLDDDSAGDVSGSVTDNLFPGEPVFGGGT